MKILNQNRSVWVFVFLFVLFLLPILAAHLIVKYGRNYLVQHRKHYGALLQPPFSIQHLILYDATGRRLKDFSLQKKWRLIYLSRDAVACQKSCQERLFFMRQIQLALGKEGVRLRNWFVVTPPTIRNLEKLKSDLNRFMVYFAQTSQKKLNDFLEPVFTIYDDGHKPLISFLTTDRLSSNQFVQRKYLESGFYLVDPMGYVIMFYSLDENFDHILKDLKHLLKVSRIG